MPETLACPMAAAVDFFGEDFVGLDFFVGFFVGFGWGRGWELEGG